MSVTRGCGPNCRCVKKMDNIREEALNGLISDSLDKFVPCDILKEELEELKKELTTIREKIVVERELAGTLASANDNLGDVSELTATASTQAEKLAAIREIAKEMGVKTAAVDKVVEREQKPAGVMLPVPAMPAKKTGTEQQPRR